MRQYVSKFARRGCVGMVCAALLLGLTSCASIVRPNFSTELTELRSGAYSLDPEHAYVHFKIGHLGLSSIVGRFNTIAGELDFDPANIGSLELQGVIDAASIDVNNDSLEDQLRGGSWLDADAFPQLTFVSTSVDAQADGTINISGTLTIRGISQTVVLETRFNGGADNILTGKYTLGFTATTRLNRSDFGMDAFAALIADTIDVELHGEFQRN